MDNQATPQQTEKKEERIDELDLIGRGLMRLVLMLFDKIKHLLKHT